MVSAEFLRTPFLKNGAIEGPKLAGSERDHERKVNGCCAPHVQSDGLELLVGQLPLGLAQQQLELPGRPRDVLCRASTAQTHRGGLCISLQRGDNVTLRGSPVWRCSGSSGTGHQTGRSKASRACSVQLVSSRSIADPQLLDTAMSAQHQCNALHSIATTQKRISGSLTTIAVRELPPSEFFRSLVHQTFPRFSGLEGRLHARRWWEQTRSSQWTAKKLLAPGELGIAVWNVRCRCTAVCTVGHI